MKSLKFLLLLTGLLLSNVSYAVPNKKILFISSYSPNTPVVQSLNHGIRDAIAKQNKFDFTIYELYFDTLRLGESQNPEMDLSYFKHRYRDTTFDMVISEGSYANQFVNQFLSKAFKTATPIIYLADIEEKLLLNPQDYRVVKDKALLARKTFELAKKLQPNTNKVVTANDNVHIGQIFVDTLQQQAYENMMTFRQLPANTIDGYIQEVKKLNKEELFFYTLITKDASGKTILPQDFAKKLGAQTDFPIWGFYDTFLGTGIVGGYVVDFYTLGNTAIQAAIDYFQYGFYHPKAYETAYLKLDAQVFEHFGLNKNLVPTEAIWVNQRVYIWQEYPLETANSLLVIVIISILLALLLTSQRKIKRQSAQNLVQADKLIQKSLEAERNKANFLASMSHEIRTPVSGIIGLTDLALKTELSELQRDYLERSRNSAKALLHIINDILDFSKFESGKHYLNEEAFRFSQLMNNISDLFALQIEQKGLAFRYQIDPQIPENFIGDAPRIQQVLTNLIGNSLKFTEQGEIALEIEMLYDSTQQTTLQFKVIDSGKGIVPAYLETIFQLYQQEKQTTKKFQGTGLGLAISKQLIEQMGGEIHARNNPDHGATFEFYINLDKPLADPSKTSDELLSGIQDQKILAIVENKQERHYLQSLFDFWSVKAVLVENRFEAFEQCKTKRFSRLLICYQANKRVALEEVEMLISNNFRYPTLLMVSTTEQLELCQQQTFDAQRFTLCAKPFTPQQLLEALSNQTQVKPSPEKPIQAMATQLHALLVEDNEVNQIVIQALLEKHGFSVTIANNGQEAVNAVKREAFDTIFMDIQMPVMDGLTATQTIRRIGFQKPIFALSAAAFQEDRERSLQAGMNEHLVKPVDEAEFERVMQSYFANPSSNRPSNGNRPQSQFTLEEIPELNLDELRRNTGMDNAQIRKLLQRFANHQQNSLQKIRQLNATDREFSDYIEKLKRTAGNLSLPELFELCEAFETTQA